VHIDIDPSTISVNYRTAHALVGDARLVLEALHVHLVSHAPRRERTDFDGRSVVARARKAKFDAFHKLASEPRGRYDPSVCSPICIAYCPTTLLS
jgi:thiamine pyrophosphate-dependent acetolactate synthase large subunit-like protein